MTDMEQWKDRRFSPHDLVTYKESSYVIESLGSLRHPGSGAWIPAYIYRNQQGDVFCREKADFEAKFKLVERAPARPSPFPVKKDNKVAADPLFGGGGGHQAWGADCPHCGQYWESLGTERESPIECDRCGESFEVCYPGGNPR